MKNIHKFVKIILRFFVSILGVILLGLLIPYLLNPVYRFLPTEVFSGNLFYNPYSQIDSTLWKRCNFHAHCRAWGGITDGGNSPQKNVLSAYKEMGYDYAGISNYQKINILSNHPQGFIPSYEHGFNIKKRHHLVLGADRVSWLDFFFWQNLNHKQFVINNLQRDADFLIINHPQFEESFLPSDFSSLSNYDAIEVLNHYRTSVSHWDSALSSGYYTFLSANDDMHDLYNVQEMGKCLTLINTQSTDRQSIISTLRKGTYLGIKMSEQENETFPMRTQRLKKLPYPLKINMKGDTIELQMNQIVNQISFIGQNGILKKEVTNSDTAIYIFSNKDTYIRIEIRDKEDNLLLFNPIARTKTPVIIPPQRAEINIFCTTVKYAVETILILLLTMVLVRWRKKKIK
ncbi:MAG: hypothetical protein LBR36_02985 [Bacteroidales bacterium]|nr:hypothetical protein [Bacteroidales bacterium]